MMWFSVIRHVFLLSCLFGGSLGLSTARDLTCKECVSLGCTFCKGEPLFSSPDACSCTNGVPYEYIDSYAYLSLDCQTKSFGSTEFDTNSDCTFQSPNGSAIVASIVICVVGIISCICYCICRCNRNGNDSDEPHNIAKPTNIHQTPTMFGSLTPPVPSNPAVVVERPVMGYIDDSIKTVVATVVDNGYDTVQSIPSAPMENLPIVLATV